ncbi:MAG: hypothetical protein ACLVJ6_11340 [Merdibacter sp.]
MENDHPIKRKYSCFTNDMLTKMLKNLLADLRLRLNEADAHLLQNYVETLGFYSSRQSSALGSESG